MRHRKHSQISKYTLYTNIKFEHLLNIQGCITRMCGGEAKIRQSCVQETDSGRATLTDIFCNTSGFSAKTVQAIYKETLYKVGTVE